MIRYGNLFEKAFTPEALYLAYLDARKGKRSKRSCFNFEKHLAVNLAAIHEELHSDQYKVAPYFEFMIYEPKPRRIFAPAFRDTVVQHAIYRVVYPLFSQRFIDQSFACRPSMGTHKAADYAQSALQHAQRASYTLKLDIRKFFYRIDRQILRAQVERVIKDRRFVDVMMSFAGFGEPVGIPIGNLLSQLFALIYLNPLDHYIKRTLKVKKYCRYVDDLVLFNLTSRQCDQYEADIKVFITTHLNLEYSKVIKAPIKRGVNFVGYRTWTGARFIRKHSMYKFRQAVRKRRFPGIVSILGHALRTHTLKSLLSFLKERHYGVYRQLPKTYRCDPNRGACPTAGPDWSAYWDGIGDYRRGDVCQPADRCDPASAAA